MSAGTVIFFLAGMPGQRVENERETVFDVFHFACGVFSIPRVHCAIAPFGISNQEGQFAGGNDRESAGLITGIDIGEIGNAVARHVVMIEGAAELLRWEDLVFDASVRGLFDRSAPILHRLLQRVSRRHPMGELELEGLVLGERARVRNYGEEYRDLQLGPG
jgi:hypothetical protein